MVKPIPMTPSAERSGYASRNPVILGPYLRRRRLDGDSFFAGFGWSMVLLAIAGFYPTYIAPLARGIDFGIVIHVHAAAFFGWVLLFAGQASLIRLRRVSIHRRMGVFGVVLALMMLVLGLTVSLIGGARDVASGDVIAARSFLLITVTDILLFAALVAAAILRRRRVQTHRRLMLLATIALMPAAIGRFFGVHGIGPEGELGFTIGTVILVGIALAHDYLTRGSIHRSYLFAAPIFVGIHFLRLWLMTTPAWHVVAERLIG
jgi:hypothetical protein